MDYNQLEVNRILRYTNEDKILSNNYFSDVICNGLILDLSELTSEKEVYSYSIYYYDSVSKKTVLEDVDTFLDMKYTEQVECDDEYIVYIDFLTKKLIIRYYEIGIKEFTDTQFLLTRFRNPYGGWEDNGNIINNEVIVNFYSYSGRNLCEYRCKVSNRYRDYEYEIDDYCLIFINDNEKLYYNYEVGLNKLSFYFTGTGEAEDFVVENMVFKKPIEREIFSNMDVNNVDYPWTIFGLWTFDEENFERKIVVYFVNNIFQFNYIYDFLLFKIPYKSNIIPGDVVGHMYLFNQIGSFINILQFEENNIEPLLNNENENIGYVTNFSLDKNVVYFYSDEV